MTSTSLGDCSISAAKKGKGEPRGQAEGPLIIIMVVLQSKVSRPHGSESQGCVWYLSTVHWFIPGYQSKSHLMWMFYNIQKHLNKNTSHLYLTTINLIYFYPLLLLLSLWQYGLVPQNEGSGCILFWIQIPALPFIICIAPKSFLSSPNLNFLICKIEVVGVPILYGYCKTGITW